jgi:hypothetical protein
MTKSAYNVTHMVIDSTIHVVLWDAVYFAGLEDVIHRPAIHDLGALQLVCYRESAEFTLQLAISITYGFAFVNRPLDSVKGSRMPVSRY